MNLSHYYSADDLRENLDQFKKIFFYRVCGTGMGASAVLLREKGLEVEGGDFNYYPPMSTYLEEMNLPLHHLDQVDHQFLQNFDLIVVGNVVPRDSACSKLIEESGIPFCSFPAALGAFVLTHINNVVGLAGTHGKTTTTHLCAQIFDHLGLKPGYLIGGVLPHAPSAQLGSGEWFFIESDEYDSAYFEKFSKFHNYFIDHLVITSLEFDHADIFDSIEDIKGQFRSILPQVSKSILINSDYEVSQLLVNELDSQSSVAKTSYGLNDQVGPHHLRVQTDKTQFQLTYQSTSYDFETNLIGRHNILNLSVALLLAFAAGASADKIQAACQKLQMVRRRQEVRGHFGELLVIDDFAHHPTAVRETLSALSQKYPELPLYVVIEPNSATARSSLFQKEFGDALGPYVQKLVVARPARENHIAGLENLDLLKLAHQVEQSGERIEAHVCGDLSELRDILKKWSTQKAVLAVLSNGTCLGLWESDFSHELV